MANMTFKASLLPNTDLGYSLGSSTQRWKINGFDPDDIYVNISGDTMTGSLGIKTESPYITLKHTPAGTEARLNLTWASSNNQGLWSSGYYDGTTYTSSSLWLIYRGSDGNVTMNGHATSATYATSYLASRATVSGNTHAAALQTYFTNNNSTIPRNCLQTYYSSAYGNGSQCFGYWLSGYNSNPYGGFFVAHYNTPKYVGIQNGTYTEKILLAATSAGTADTQALVSNGANADPKWVNISPGITITAGTASATPKVNVTVLGRSGTAQALTTATTGVYGCTKLTSSYTASDSTLAATGASIAAAIGGLDVAAVGGGTGEYISKIQETDGKISATKATTSVSNAWTAGTTAGPTIKTTVNGIAGTAVAIPTATASASGAVTTGEQTWAGVKHFNNNITIGARTAWNKAAAGITIYTDGTMHLGHASSGGSVNFHWAAASATTAYISEGQSGTVRVSNCLAVNTSTKWQTLGGAATTTAFQFAVLGNGFIRDTIYTNAALTIRKALTSSTAYNTVFSIYNNNVVYSQLQIYNGTAATAGQCYFMVGNSTATGNANNANGVYRAYNAAGGYAQMWATRGALGGTTRDYMNFSYVKGTQVWGAVWNDYAEFRKTKEQIEPGRCVIETGKGDMILSTERLQNGAEIISDTFGFAIGQNEHNNTPIAVSGRVLAYLYEDKEYAWDYIGWPVCSGPNGTVSIMTEEEASKYPWKIIGTISEIPNYDKWQIGEKEDNNFIDVNNRIWIRIK